MAKPYTGPAPILVGFDASDDAVRALEYAARLAARTKTMLEIVYVADDTVTSSAWGRVRPRSGARDREGVPGRRRRDGPRPGGGEEADPHPGGPGHPGRCAHPAERQVPARDRGPQRQQRQRQAVRRVDCGGTCGHGPLPADGRGGAARAGLRAADRRRHRLLRQGRSSPGLGAGEPRLRPGEGHQCLPGPHGAVPLPRQPRAHRTGDDGHARAGDASGGARDPAEHMRSVTTEVLYGSPVDELVARSGGLAKLVVEAHPSFPTYTVGGTVRGILAHAQCPVVIVR
ncbi:MAG: universal stress protein [Micropruina sp.]|nr:MAG: universal stress protein [Micropruina sp.]